MTGAMTAWIPFFSTVAESTATLAGLVIVAVSVNVEQIIAFDHLPARAFGAIGALIQVVVTSLAALMPQPVQAFALELGVAAVIAWVMYLRNMKLILPGHAELGRPAHERITVVLLGLAQLLPLSIGAVMIGFGDLGGLYIVALAALVALVIAALNAWVLLVEILR